MKLSCEIEFPHACVCLKQFILRPAIILGTCKLPCLVCYLRVRVSSSPMSFSMVFLGRTKHSTKQSCCSLFCYTKFHSKIELKFRRNCTKQTCLFFFRALAGIEIFIFHHAPKSGTSTLHDNFMKNMFLRAHICPFTNGQICKRTNNLRIDK